MSEVTGVRVRVACTTCGAQQVLRRDEVMDDSALCLVCGRTRPVSILAVEIEIENP